MLQLFSLIFLLSWFCKLDQMFRPFNSDCKYTLATLRASLVVAYMQVYGDRLAMLRSNLSTGRAFPNTILHPATVTLSTGLAVQGLWHFAVKQSYWPCSQVWREAGREGGRVEVTELSDHAELRGITAQQLVHQLTGSNRSRSQASHMEPVRDIWSAAIGGFERQGA